MFFSLESKLTITHFSLQVDLKKYNLTTYYLLHLFHFTFVYFLTEINQNAFNVKWVVHKGNI